MCFFRRFFASVLSFFSVFFLTSFFFSRAFFSRVFCVFILFFSKFLFPTFFFFEKVFSLFCALDRMDRKFAMDVSLITVNHRNALPRLCALQRRNRFYNSFFSNRFFFVFQLFPFSRKVFFQVFLCSKRPFFFNSCFHYFFFKKKGFILLKQVFFFNGFSFNLFLFVKKKGLFQQPLFFNRFYFSFFQHTLFKCFWRSTGWIGCSWKTCHTILSTAEILHHACCCAHRRRNSDE